MSYKGYSVPASKLKTSYDVIVIGAGIGGLICANFLAKNGYSVLIVEQHYKPGGLCSSFRREGFTFDAGAHLFGGIGNPRSLTGTILSRLDLNLDVIPQNPLDLVHIGNETITIPADSGKYVSVLQDMFPKEAGGIARFFEDLSVINKTKAANPDHDLVKSYEMTTYYRMLGDYFTDENLKAVLSAQWGYLGLPAKKVSALTMCLMLGSYFLDGAFVIRGGSQRLPDQLAEHLLGLGGQILLAHEATHILTDDDRATGVKLKGRQTVKGRCVVSNVDAKQTFLKLLPRTCLKEDFVMNLLGYKESCSMFVTFLGLKGANKLVEGINGWHFESYSDILAQEDFFLLLASTGDSPKGQCALRILVPIFDSGHNWQEEKKAFENGIVSRLEKRCPGLGDKIVYRESASPATYYRYTRNSRGAAYGWALTPEAQGRFRLDNRTPIRNLFLTGHWTKPGTGVASAIHSGFLTAVQIMGKD
ncbi:MAG: NAD(P)/FAD-dependent oxidoreductase [Desulfobacterales bacterium]|nr:NAD(P)/FAD-dependent oxidoreductase [Desulfobacterales bacterium]